MDNDSAKIRTKRLHQQGGRGLHAKSCRSLGDHSWIERSSRLGLSIVELLIILAVIGILVGLGAMLFTRLNQRTTVESATTELSQTVMQARNRALQAGNRHRVLVSGTKQYVLQVESGGNWTTQRTISLPGAVSFSGTGTGSAVTFDTRGFADFNPTGLVFRLSDGQDTFDVAAAMSGTTRIRR